MSVSLWAFKVGECDGGGCPGDCDLCTKWLYREDDEEKEQDAKLQAWLERLGGNNE